MKKYVFIFFIISSQVFGQNPIDALRPFWGYEYSQVLSNSIGNATVASGYITPGLTSNPANLAAIQFGYFQLNFSNSQYNSNSSSVTNTGFNGIDLVHPVKVFRGRLVYSLGAHKKSDFISNYQDNTSRFNEKGKLTSYHVAAALEFARNLYLGADFNFLYGNNEMTVLGNDKTYYYKPRYSGSNITLGLLHILSKNFQYGLSVDMPTSLSVKEKYIETNYPSDGNTFSQVYNYEAIKPITLHFGAALLLKSVNFFYEGKQTDWSNLEFDSNEIVEQDGTPASILINEEIRNIYTSTTSHHFGTAIKLRDTPINLFSGYQYIPTPFNSVDEENINEVFARHAYNFGISLSLQKNITIQGSYENYNIDIADESNNFERISIGLSLHDLSGFWN